MGAFPHKKSFCFHNSAIVIIYKDRILPTLSQMAFIFIQKALTTSSLSFH